MGLVLGVILLDGGVQAAQVANQTRVLGLRPDARNRLNTVYMICYFGGSNWLGTSRKAHLSEKAQKNAQWSWIGN
ncbi:MAG: hypothetical protein ACJ746_10570 [Bryobacteraceae bacterium]